MIIYPRGSGGNWLGNLIWHLENSNFELPNVDTVFDNEPKGSIKTTHGFEIYDPLTPNNIAYKALRTANDVIFSSRYLFNHYLNNAVKVKYHIHRLDQQSLQQQLFELSNGACYYFTNQHYYDYYCGDITLDYSTVFTDSEQFATQLFALLNKLNRKFAPNLDYVLASIAYYRSTCPDPGDHYDNFQSILWLGCCQAITRMDNLSIDVIKPDSDLADLQRILMPHAQHFKSRVKPLMFEWTK